MPITTPTQIRIPDDLKAAAKAKADTEGRTLSAVVIALLRDWTEQPPLTPVFTPPPPYR